MTATILVTGFGRFPGAPFNPAADLATALVRRRRPALAGVRLVGHVFATRWDEVDEALPRLVAQEKPDAVLLLGVAGRAARVRIEQVARNRASVLFPDAGGARRTHPAIATGAPFFRRGRFPAAALRAALRTHGIDAASSRNAGTYLCNFAYWRALDAADRDGGPRLVVFVHVPPLHRLGLRRLSPHRLGAAAPRRLSRRCHIAAERARLLAALEALLVRIAATLR